MKERDFDQIVGDFYRAATGAIEWRQALEGVQRAFGARAAVLHTLDVASGRLLSLHGGGPDLAETMLVYVRDYHQIDPRRQRVVEQGVAGAGVWQHDHEHFGADFVARNRFYQHFLPAYDARYNATLALPVGDTVVSGFALELHSSRGPLDGDEREIVRRLGQHLQDALLTHRRMLDLLRRALAGHGLLEAFAYPMWLLDESRQIVFENPAAVTETERATRAARRGPCLVFTRGRSDIRLVEAITLLRHAGHGGTRVVDLSAGGADTPAWLHVSRLVPSAVLGAFGERPLMLVTLFDPMLTSALDTFALGNLFGLTPTEAKVAARLAEGMTAEQIGQAHGTTLATVRTQIKRVLAKLGVARAVDVVRMLKQGGPLWAATSSRASDS
jgi:DNA-binding CsgD family transcriptional regulator